MKLIVVFLSLFVYSKCISSILNEAIDCSNKTSRYEKKQMFNMLYDWCVDDEECSSLYEQSEEPDFTIFYNLIKHIIGNEDSIEKPLFEIFCNEEMGIENKMLSFYWLNIMKGNRHKSTLCDVNHVAQVNPETKKIHCVCKFDKLCMNSESEDETNLSIFILLTIISTLSLLVFGTRSFAEFVYFSRVKDMKPEIFMRLLNAERVNIDSSNT
jgi:hypothetical protein